MQIWCGVKEVKEDSVKVLPSGCCCCTGTASTDFKSNFIASLKLRNSWKCLVGWLCHR